MKASDNAIRLITSSEGFEETLYLDTANIYTVGWGHALKTPAGQNIDVDIFGPKALAMAQESMKRVFGTLKITKQQADVQMKKDLSAFESEVSKLLPPDTTQAQFDAMLSFAYNCGVTAFKGSAIYRLHRENKRSVGNLSLTEICRLSKAKASPTTMAIAYARWVNSGGKWTLGLFRRRMAEVLVYSGWDAQKALTAAWAFRD